MKKFVFCFAAGALFAVSCGSNEVAEVTEALSDVVDSTEVVDENEDNANEQPVAPEPAAVSNDMGSFMAYGFNRDFDVATAISVDDMHMGVMTNGATEAVVTGQCAEICQMAGCWIEVAKADGEKVFVKFKDHFTLPIDGTTGKTVYFHGTGKMDTTSIEMQKHYLDDRAKNGEEVPQSEYDAITEPKVDVVFIADGILVAEATADVVE